MNCDRAMDCFSSDVLKETVVALAACISTEEDSLLQPRTKRMMGRLLTAMLAILPFVEDAHKRKSAEEAVEAWLSEVNHTANKVNNILNQHEVINHSSESDAEQTSREQQQVSRCLFLSCSTSPDKTRKRKMMRNIMKTLEKISREGRALGFLTKLDFTIPADQSSQWPEELKGRLAELDGDLHISQLRNENNVELPTRVLLIKKHAHAMELRWRWDNEWDGTLRGFDDEILEGLQTHPDLKSLIIMNHCGAELPRWIENQWLPHLETIELHCCQSWDFPTLGKLPCLKNLDIDGTSFDTHPVDDSRSDWYRPWDKLQFYSTQGWDRREQEHQDEDDRLFPILRILRINNCYNLERLPLLPPTLKELRIHEGKLTELPGLQGFNGIATSSSSSSSLSSLHISSLNGLTTLRRGLLANRLDSLESLTLSECYQLETFPEDGLSSLVSLKTLCLNDCHQLTWLPGNGCCFPSSLVDLRIKRCDGILTDSFFMGLQNLTSLTSLYIEDVELDCQADLTSLPTDLLRHWKALNKLEIINIRNLVTLGFQALVSLRRLKICGSEDLVSPPPFEGHILLPLEYLEIERSTFRFLSCELLQCLTSLQEISISQSFFDEELAEGLCYLISLRKLFIDRCVCFDSISDEIGSLTSLEELIVVECYFYSMLEKGFPASLRLLVLNTRKSIPLSNEDLQVGGLYWHKIAHIAYVEINWRVIETEAWKQL